MSKPYEKECIFCHKKIRMSDEMGKWKPYNVDGSEHDCKNKGQQKLNSNNNGNDNHADISLELLLKKLKSIGVTIDLDVLKNAVNGGSKQINANIR